MTLKCIKQGGFESDHQPIFNAYPLNVWFSGLRLREF